MRLRNKITNKICDAEAREDGIYVKTNFGDGEKWHKYGLGCLADNWEYYVEPKEPLIKDEKIRKAVRAWAEANTIRAVYYSPEEDGFYVKNFDDEIVASIYFGDKPMEEDGYGEHYTIDELCGEGEE